MSAIRVALVALSAAALSAACAAGQNAQTANEKPSIDATQGQVGSMQLEGVALHAPNAPSYPSGADVALNVYIANSGRTSDTLTNVSSPAFAGGWSIVDTSVLAASASAVAASSAAAAASSSAAASAPLPTAPFTPSVSASSSSAPTAPSAGTPQQVPAGAALALGLQNLSPSGAVSSRTLVLHGLVDKNSPLFPGTAVKITFTFAKAGSTTLTVPVQITAKPNTQTLPLSYSPPS